MPAVASLKKNVRFHPYKVNTEVEEDGVEFLWGGGGGGAFMLKGNKRLGSFVPWVRTLDLSQSTLLVLPNLRELTPFLEVLRCFNMPISFITCDFPSSLRKALFDGSSVRYVSRGHLSGDRCISVISCRRLKKAPLIARDSGAWWKRGKRVQVRMDEEGLVTSAAIVIQRAWRGSR